MLHQGSHVNSLFSRKTKFPQASLLVFLFLVITEIRKVTSSALPTDGVTNVEKAFEKHYGASLTDAHFRTGNGSRHDLGFCLLDDCFCLLDLFDECCGSCNPLSFICSGGKGKCIPKGEKCDQDRQDDKCCAPNGEIYGCNSKGTCAYACTREGYNCTHETTCCSNGELPGNCDLRSKTCKICRKNGDECIKGDYCCDGGNGDEYKCSDDERCEKLCRIDPNDMRERECSVDADGDCCNDDEGNEYRCEATIINSEAHSLCEKKCAPEENPSGNCKVDANCCPDKYRNQYHCVGGTCASMCNASSGQSCEQDRNCCNDKSKNVHICSETGNGKTCKRMCNLNPGEPCVRDRNDDECCGNDDKGNAYDCIFDENGGKCRKLCSVEPNHECSSNNKCCNDDQGNVYNCEDGKCQKAKFLRIKQSVRKTLW